MSSHMRALLRIKTRFEVKSGVRFHTTSKNAEALALDEKECSILGSLPTATAHATEVKQMMGEESWPRVKFEGSIPLLLWTTCFENLIQVKLIVDIK